MNFYKFSPRTKMQILILGILALWGGYSLIPANEESLEKKFGLAAGTYFVKIRSIFLVLSSS